MRFLFLIFFLASCSDMQFTAPLCGPESIDQRPFADIPADASGCYEFNVEYLASNDLASRGGSSFLKLDVRDAETEAQFDGSGHNVPDWLSSYTLCQMSASTDRRYLAQTSQGSSFGLFFVTFGTSAILLQPLSVDIERLRDAKLSTARIPKYDRQGKPELSDGFIVDNRGLNLDEFFARLSPSPLSAALILNRVDDKKCSGLPSRRVFKKLAMRR